LSRFFRAALSLRLWAIPVRGFIVSLEKRLDKLAQAHAFAVSDGSSLFDDPRIERHVYAGLLVFYFWSCHLI
jgi:hypothetical protein